MSYIFWGFLFGVLIPYMARRFAKFMPATAAYALYRLLWPVKTVSDERKRANPAYQKLMSAYVMRSLGYGIITAAISYAAYWQFGAAHLWWYLAFIWILLLLTEIDYKTMYLPDILTFPLLLAGIGVGAQTLGAASPDGPGGWLGVACAFDAVFLGAGLLLFSFIYTGDE